MKDGGGLLLVQDDALGFVTTCRAGVLLDHQDTIVGPLLDYAGGLVGGLAGGVNDGLPDPSLRGLAAWREQFAIW